MLPAIGTDERGWRPIRRHGFLILLRSPTESGRALTMGRDEQRTPGWRMCRAAQTASTDIGQYLSPWCITVVPELERLVVRSEVSDKGDGAVHRCEFEVERLLLPAVDGETTAGGLPIVDRPAS